MLLNNRKCLFISWLLLLNVLSDFFNKKSITDG